MKSTIYLAGVSGAGKTTIVTQLWHEGIPPIYFSGEMKRIATEKQLITQPEQVYRLSSDIRLELENAVREDLKNMPFTGQRVIDGHIVVEDWVGGYRNTFNDIQAQAIDHLIFILSDPQHIVHNRQQHTFRPMSATSQDVAQAQEHSITRIHYLKTLIPSLKLDIIHHTTNDINTLYNLVKEKIT